MRLSQLFPAVLILLLLSSCTTEMEDCICTEEFRVISVLITDGSGDPIEGLTATITDEKGKHYILPDSAPLSGYYIVMSDKYVQDFSTSAKKILFTAASDSGSVNGEYFINTDRCKCHIQKISGPDTLVFK